MSPMEELAAVTHELFTVYWQAGFTEDQALTLCAKYMHELGLEAVRGTTNEG